MGRYRRLANPTGRQWNHRLASTIRRSFTVRVLTPFFLIAQSSALGRWASSSASELLAPALVASLMAGGMQTETSDESGGVGTLSSPGPDEEIDVAPAARSRHPLFSCCARTAGAMDKNGSVRS